MQTVGQWLDRQEQRIQRRLDVLEKLRGRQHDKRRAELQVAAIQEERLRVEYHEEEYDLETTMGEQVPAARVFYFGPDWLWVTTRLGYY
jgi:aspartokinase